MASAVTPDGRVNIMNRNVTRLRGDAATTTRLPKCAVLRALLCEHFGFDIPEVETLHVPGIPDLA